MRKLTDRIFSAPSLIFSGIVSGFVIIKAAEGGEKFLKKIGNPLDQPLETIYYLAELDFPGLFIALGIVFGGVALLLVVLDIAEKQGRSAGA